jgi:hypothetical protein
MFVEASRFKVFHYLGRPEVLVDRSDAKTVVSSDTCVCLIEMNDTLDAKALIEQYHGLQWRNAKQEYVDNSICIIQSIVSLPSESVDNENGGERQDKQKLYQTQKEVQNQLKTILKEKPDNENSVEILHYSTIFDDSIRSEQTSMCILFKILLTIIIIIRESCFIGIKSSKKFA